MASSILNLVFDKFLSNIVEIDASKTNFSLLSGKIELRHLKIKDELFQTLNLPFIEVAHGYIGKILIDLSMPFFYNNPIKVVVNKIFFHARLKNINKLNKEEEIKNMQKLKDSSLLSAEEVKAQILDIQKQNAKNTKKTNKNEKKEPTLVEKIINNLFVEINDIVFKLDDEISFPEIPYSLGVILENIKIRTTRSDFKIPANSDEVIPTEEINFKVVAIDNFSVYMDCFDDKEELDYERLISSKVTKKIDVDLRNYLRDQLSFYTYCMSEVHVHSKKFEAHQYLLHQLDLSVKLAMNNNPMNGQPKISVKVAFPQILLGVSIKQIKAGLKLKAYNDLNTLYRNGIAKELYDKELTQNEKSQYIDGYLGYFQKKYIEKQNVEYPTSLKNTEEHLNYDTISQMRSTALQKLTYTSKINELTKKIQKEQGSLFGKNDAKIAKLMEERNRVIKIEEEFIKTGKAEEIEDSTAAEQDELKDLEDTYVKIYAYIDILITSFTIYETVIRKPDKTWELQNKLLSIVIKDLGTEAKIQKVGLIALVSLDNIIVAQEKVTNPNYNKIFFGDLTVQGKLLCITLEINPKLKKSDLRVKVWSERQVYIIVDMYTLLYIKEQIMTVLATSIDLEEVGSYAKDGIYNYIKEGYQDRLVEGNTGNKEVKFTHSNLYLDVSLKSPIIILPIDIFDFNNHQCLLMSLGSLKVKTILPPRVNDKINYARTKDESLLYDIYRVGVLGIRMATVEECVEKNNYVGTETVLLKEFDVSVEAKLLIQPKNINNEFHNMIINVLIPEINFQLNEFQILLLITFLGKIGSAQNKLEYEMKIRKIEERRNRRKLRELEHEKILESLSQEARKEREKEREKELEKNREERKKKREEENIKKAKIVYDKVIKSFSMSDHSAARREMIRVKNGKKSILVNLVIVKTRFAIKKMFADLSIEDYLVFQIDMIKVGVNIMLNGIMLIEFMIKHISLSDVDKDEKKQLYLNPNYVCLIENAKEGQMGNYGTTQESKSCFIDLTMLMLGDELDMIINMNDLHIIISLNTLLRLYQFGMYYLDIFTLENFHTETDKFLVEKAYKKRLKELDEKEQNGKKQEKIEEIMDDEIKRYYIKRLKKYVNNPYSIEQAKEFVQKRHKIKTLDNYINYFAESESSKKGKKVMVFAERKRSKMRLIFNMNNTMFKLPLDHIKTTEPILSMYFNMTFSMDAANVYDDLIAIPSRKLLAQIYETKTSFMHVSLSQFEFDMVYLNPTTKRFKRNPASERFLSNFRLKCSIDSYINPYIEESYMNINVLLEPLILAFGMRQLRKLMDFSKVATAFLPKMKERYYPNIKPEHVINGVPQIPPKKKYHVKEVIRKILTRNMLNKVLKQKIKKQDVKKEQQMFINTNRFNNKMGISCKIDKICLVLFNNVELSKSVLLQINLTKLLVKMITNSRMRSKDNMILALYEILSADVLPRTKFDLSNLATYMDIVFSIDANYLNIMTNNFEPLLERFNMGINMLQVAPISKNKGYITTNDIINFNLSTDSVIALNKFLETFLQDEKLWDKNNPVPTIFDPMKSSHGSHDSALDIQREYEKEICLKFINLTGIDLSFYFDDNPNYKIPIRSGGKVPFTRTELYKARGHDRHRNPYQKTTFSLCIGDCKPIENINFQRNNYRQFKSFLQSSNGRRYPVYFGIKVENSGIMNVVTICPSLSFYNDTKFETMFLLINNPSIPNNTIIIPKETKGYVPLTWLMCDSPESQVSIKFSQNGQYTQLCNNISEFFVKAINDPHLLKERESEKNKVQKAFPNANNPTFIKIIDIQKSELDNRKDSKYLNVQDNGANRAIYLDYFLLQTKDINKLRESEPDYLGDNTNINNAPVDMNASMSSLIPINNQIVEFDYEYIIYVRPYLTIINKAPFAINLSCSEGNKAIEPLKKECFYSSDMNNLKFTMEYNNNVYTSNLFSLNQENTYVDLTSNASVIPIKCHIYRNPVKITIPSPQKFFCDIKDYSISSYEYIFFFDYLFANRLSRKIWVRPCDSKGVAKLSPGEINQKVLELQPSSINLLSLPDYETDCSIKDEHSPWSEPFNMNTIGVQGVVKLDSTNFPVPLGSLNSANNQGNNFQANTEIACLLSGSDVYDFSVIIVFEPKYIIINNLGFDIVYKQETCTNIYPLRAKENKSLIYEKGEKDFRIGIKDDATQTYNYSNIFNLENVMDVDIKIRIDINSTKFNNREMKLFSYDGREYYILIRVINQTYDQGTVYILLTHVRFPYLEIANLTGAPLRVYEEGTTGITITNLKEPIVPFVWENSNKHKDIIFFDIYGRQEKFNYSIFKKNEMYISERDIKLNYFVSSKNKTITRRFEIQQEEGLTKVEHDAMDLYFKNKKRPTSSFFDVFIRGLGISIIDNTPQEIFYISLYNLQVKYISNVLNLEHGSQTDTTMNAIVKLDNFQIDYCLNDSLRVVLAPKDQLVPSIEPEIREVARKEKREITPFISVLLTMSTKENHFKEEKLSAYEQIDFVMQEFDIKVEQYALMNVLKIVMEMVGAFDFSKKINAKEDKEPLLDMKQEIPIKKLLNENENSVMQLIYYLLVGALKFNLTLRLDLSSIPLGLPKTAKRVIGTIGNTLGRITDCPLRFNEKVVENVYMSWADVSMIIVKSYITQGITQIYKVLGSLDIIGNPVKLVRNVGGGFYDFVNEPRKGFRLGPKEFGIGVAKGVGSLIYGIVGGVLDFLQRISGTLYAATQSLTGHDRESMSIEDENEPSNILSGFGEGFVGFGKEIGKGFYALCAEPCQKAQTSGAGGFCKGIGGGLLKLVISPFAGILKLITCILAGCKNTCFLLTGKQRVKTSRFRHPRVIVEGDKKLLPYENNKAEAREILYQLENIDTNNILFADDFICPDCPRRMSTAILTDKYMYVIYNNNKIIFKLNTRLAENAFVHYIDNKFYLAFKMKNKSTRGFPIRSEYSTVATGLHDILYHKYNKAQIMYSHDGKQGPVLMYNDLTQDDLFDKSSYAKTLIGEQSVYSDKTLLSKITVRKSNRNKNIQRNETLEPINEINENESVQQLAPKQKDSEYISLNVKE